MTTRGATARLATRVVLLGLARASLLGARTLLFIVFGFTLDARAYGTVAVLLTLGSAASALIEGGVGLMVLQRTGRDPDQVREALGGLVVLRLLLLPAVLLLHCLVARAILGNDFTWETAVYFGAYTTLLPLAHSVFAFFRSINLARYEAVASLVLHGLEAANTLVWAVIGHGALASLGLALGLTRAACLLSLLVLLVVRFRSSLSPRRAVALIRLGRTESIQWFVLAVAQFIYGQLDVLLLRVAWGATEAGTYWACYRLVSSLLLPVDLLIAAVMPRLATASSDARRRRIFAGMHAIGVVWTFGPLGAALFQSDWLAAHLLRESYVGTGPLLVVVASALGIAYMPPYGLGLAMGNGLSFLVRTCSLAAVVNLVLCLALIPTYAAPGAAVATGATYVVMKVVFWLGFRERRLPPMPWASLARAAAATAAWSLLTRVIAIPGSVAIAMWLVLVGALVAWEFRRNAEILEEPAGADIG